MSVRRLGAARPARTELTERWFTLFPDDPLGGQATATGTLETLKEGRLPPRSAPRAERTSGEVVTYVHGGSLVYEDSTKASDVMCAGDFYRVTLGTDFNYKETNESSTHWAHVFQVWLTPKVEREPGHERKRFSVANRRQGLCLVASPDGDHGSLIVHQDSYLYSAIMSKGRHLVHALAPHRTACLQVIEGEVRMSELVLRAGDTALVNDEPSLSFSSEGESEVLLLDLGRTAHPSNGAG